MKLLGILLIANTLALTGWQVANGGGNKWVLLASLIGIFSGIVLTFQDRITELTVQGVGSIKAANSQAQGKLIEIEQIRQRIEAQAATVDLVAKEAKETRRLTEEIKLRSDDVKKQVGDVDKALEKANANSDALSALLDFTTTVVAAQSDSRKAFDKLRSWSEDAKFPYKTEAAQAYQKILDDHAKPWTASGFTVPWKEGFDPKTLNLDGLAANYASVPEQLKPAVLEYIWNRDDISRKARMEFMSEVMKTCDSLTTLEYAGRHFTSGADLKIKPLAVDYLLDWWEKNKGTFDPN
jgi:hypothetical protein